MQKIRPIYLYIFICVLGLIFLIVDTEEVFYIDSNRSHFPIKNAPKHAMGTLLLDKLNNDPLLILTFYDDVFISNLSIKLLDGNNEERSIGAVYCKEPLKSIKIPIEEFNTLEKQEKCKTISFFESLNIDLDSIRYLDEFELEIKLKIYSNALSDSLNIEQTIKVERGKRLILNGFRVH